MTTAARPPESGAPILGRVIARHTEGRLPDRPEEIADLPTDAAGRSALYAALARAFTYEGAISGPLAINGYAFNEAFDPSVNESACSLREGTYSGGDQSALFEELMRFYSYFGLGRNEAGEMPDHICVELEFMHFLNYQESAVGDDASARQSLRRAQHDFLERHLMRLVRGIQAKLHSDNPACTELVRMAESFVTVDLARLQAN